jgi:hypothetical protein
MTLATDRVRVTLAVFDQASDLAPALIGLDQAGFESAQLGIAARASIFAVLRDAHVDGSLNAANALGLVYGSSPIGFTALQEPVRVSAGPFWPTLKCFGALPGTPLLTAPWMAPQLRDDLAQHIANGAILLGVGATSLDQQRTATQILLRHSSHRVHTHDFRH